MLAKNPRAATLLEPSNRHARYTPCCSADSTNSRHGAHVERWHTHSPDPSDANDAGLASGHTWKPQASSASLANSSSEWTQSQKSTSAAASRRRRHPRTTVSFAVPRASPNERRSWRSAEGVPGHAHVHRRDPPRAQELAEARRVAVDVHGARWHLRGEQKKCVHQFFFSVRENNSHTVVEAMASAAPLIALAAKHQKGHTRDMSTQSVEKTFANGATLLGFSVPSRASIVGYHLVHTELERLDRQGDFAGSVNVPGSATQQDEAQNMELETETNIDTTSIVVALVLAYSALALVVTQSMLKYSRGKPEHVAYSSVAAAALVGGSLAYFAPLYIDYRVKFAVNDIESRITGSDVLYPADNPATAWPGYVGVGSFALLAMVAGMDASVALSASKRRSRQLECARRERRQKHGRTTSFLEV